jgi:hypothetical protein
MLSARDLGRIRQAMLLGLARQPLEVPEPLKPLVAAAPPERDATLTVLMLAAQQQRFLQARTSAVVETLPEAARRLHQDPRPIMPEAARRALRRLAKGVEKAQADVIIAAAARDVVRAGFRLHPFDLPQLIGHIRADARCLGLAERAYQALANNAGPADAPTLLQAEITADNWAGFQKAHRVAFLRSERRKHPAIARAMLETGFKSELAHVRADLLQALEVSLGIDDLPFIESLSGDRAESVRAAAASLMAAVPGTPAFTARLAEAARCFVRVSGIGGMLRRIGVGDASPIRFAPPQSVNPAARQDKLAMLFAGLSAAEVGAAAGLTADEVIRALPANDDAVLAAFFNTAARDEDNATMVRLIEARLEAAETRTPADLLALLAEHMTEPVPIAFADRFFGAAAWEAVLERIQLADSSHAAKDDGTLVWTAAVLPPALLASFVERLALLPPAAAHTARDFAELRLALSGMASP